MKLILTRHGETEENIAGIMQGHLHGTLSSLGIAQAEKLAERLKNEKIDAIYSSDLARAAETAKMIAKYHKGIHIVYAKELRERDHGKHTGKKRSEIDLDAPSDSEAPEKMAERIGSLMKKAFIEHPQGTVLFVGHSGINRMLTNLIIKKTSHDWLDIEKPGNTAVSIFEIKEDKSHKVILINCTKHLDKQVKRKP